MNQLAKTADCLIGLDITWPREGTAAVLEGDFDISLAADFERTISIDDSGEPAFGLSPLQVNAVGDQSSHALTKLLASTEFPGPLLLELQQDILAHLNQAIAARARVHSKAFPWEPDGLRIPVYLPFLHRGLSRKWLSGEKEWTAVVEEGGRLFTHEPGPYQFAMLLATAALGTTEAPGSFELGFEDTRTMSWPEARMRLPPVLAHYGFDNSWLEAPPSRAPDLEVSWRLSIDGSAGVSWLGLPPERGLDFFEYMCTASVTLQRALRLWMPYLFLSGVDRLTNPDVIGPLLVYASMRPYRSARHRQYASDVLNPVGITRSMRWITRSVGTSLGRVHAYLQSQHRRELAKRYESRKAHAFLQDMNRIPRNLASLIACEGYLLDEMLQLAAKGREIAAGMASNPPDRARGLWRLAVDLHKALDLRLRRAWTGGGFPSLAPLVLIEMTRGFAVARGLSAAPLNVQLRIRDLSTGRDYVGTTQIADVTLGSDESSAEDAISEADEALQ